MFIICVAAARRVLLRMRRKISSIIVAAGKFKLKHAENGSCVLALPQRAEAAVALRGGIGGGNSSARDQRHVLAEIWWRREMADNRARKMVMACVRWHVMKLFDAVGRRLV